MPIFAVSSHITTKSRYDKYLDTDHHTRYVECSEEEYDMIKKELPQYEHSHEYGIHPEYSYTDHYRYWISRIIPFTNTKDLFDCIKKERDDNLKERSSNC